MPNWDKTDSYSPFPVIWINLIPFTPWKCLCTSIIALLIVLAPREPPAMSTVKVSSLKLK